jgi:hypothetical protein
MESRILMAKSSVRPRASSAPQIPETPREVVILPAPAPTPPPATLSVETLLEATLPEVTVSEVAAPEAAVLEFSRPEGIPLAAEDDTLHEPQTHSTSQREQTFPSDPPSPARRVRINPEHRPQLAAFQENAAPENAFPQQNIPESSDTSDTLSDLLRPVSGIDLRQAIEIPTLAEGDSPSLRQPLDLAQTIRGPRAAVDLSVSYWRPWCPDRDSHPFCHFPLYFEDPNLERCGRGWFCFTTVASIGHFACSTALLPVHLVAEHPRRYVRTLPDCPACHRFDWDVDLPQLPRW